MTVECANCMHSVVRTLAGKAVLYCDLYGFPRIGGEGCVPDVAA